MLVNYCARTHAHTASVRNANPVNRAQAHTLTIHGRAESLQQWIDYTSVGPSTRSQPQKRAGNLIHEVREKVWGEPDGHGGWHQLCHRLASVCIRLHACMHAHARTHKAQMRALRMMCSCSKRCRQAHLPGQPHVAGTATPASSARDISCAAAHIGPGTW